MKKTSTLMLLITILCVAFLSVSQTPKFYNSNGVLIETSRTINDSTYIKSLPATITLSNLTKADLRVFKKLMLQKVQNSDKPYDSATKIVFDKILTDLNTKADSVTTFKITNMPVSYITDYAKMYGHSYEDFVRVRQEARQFLRIAGNIQKIDTAFYFLSVENQNLDKLSLKKDLKIKP